MSIIFRQFVPRSEIGVVPRVYLVETTQELLECEWFQTIQDNKDPVTTGTFVRFSQLEMHTGHSGEPSQIVLIAEFRDNEGKHYSTLLGELSGRIDVPEWTT